LQPHGWAKICCAVFVFPLIPARFVLEFALLILDIANQRKAFLEAPNCARLDSLFEEFTDKLQFYKLDNRFKRLVSEWKLMKDRSVDDERVT
jgi:hypothetical protein